MAARVAASVVWLTPEPIITLVSLTSGTAAALAVGLTIFDWNERDPAKVEAFVEGHIKPSDIVLSDSRSFYALKRLGNKTYFNFTQRLTAEEKAAVTVLLGSEDSVKVFMEDKEIGDEWSVVDQLALPGSRFTPPFTLRVYRRDKGR